MSQYYLYRHIRPDLNVPFYVGVGKKYNPNAQSFEREYLRAFSFLKGDRSMIICDQKMVKDVIRNTNEST